MDQPLVPAPVANPPVSSSALHHPADYGQSVWALSLSALGVVFGDIGTSPLYALRECFHGQHGVTVSPANVYGVLSLVFWAMMAVVTVKYLMFVMQADNRGEGGVLALTALTQPIKTLSATGRWWLVVLGVFGASLLYGDGMITPAISVLSAVEGLNVATHVFEPYVILMTIAILVVLFLLQSHGTAGIGILFGPVMALWFVVVGVLGLWWLPSHPQILLSINPWYGYHFFAHNGWHGFLVLGSVFLVVTGGEALYADMGHFGRRPIQRAWFTLAMPALLLNYLGQGALLITRPAAASHPFYQLAPGWALYPLVILATAAAIIASQALISGAYSTTMQATQLGLLPRLLIRHTSRTQYGQIYMPTVNWILMFGCIFIVLGFRTSSGLAAAYGIAVTSTMAITSILFFTVARERWKWSLLQTSLVTGGFLMVDLAFLAANIIKIPDGGWFPLLFAVVIFTLMTTWKRGREILGKRIRERIYPLQQFFEEIERTPPLRVPGIAIFLSGSGDGVPPALLQNLEHNHVLHERVIFLTIKTQSISHISEKERVEYLPLQQGFSRVILNYGFMNEPDIPLALGGETGKQLGIDLNQVSYFLGRETLLASIRSGGMALWRERLFAAMSRNATSPSAYFQLPPQRVVELGSHVEI